MSKKVEQLIREALTKSHLDFKEIQTSYGIDFHITERNIVVAAIEEHTTDIGHRTARNPNYIITQGERAAKMIASLLETYA